MESKRANIRVNGIVQGVGFRPFVHKQVTQYGLTGWIRNTSEGVEMDVEGAPDAVDRFVAELWTKTPKLAVIESVMAQTLPECMDYRDFQIIESRALDERNTLISPDIGICADCLRELFDPANRRYRYPFINCTNCGPRFSILRDVPYDRPNTSMVQFVLCPDCETEYRDITDRRYHAQPNCCSVCGPKLFFLDAEGNPLGGDPIAAAQRWLREGKIIAVKGLGGIHLACRCDDPETVSRLRKRKHRDEKPFALMCRDIQTVRRYAAVSEQEEAALTGFRRPIVLLHKHDNNAMKHISENGRIGIMLPYTPVHYLLLDGELDSLVMTSANLSDMPILTDNREALEKLAQVADGFLLNDRPIENRCDDSLLWVRPEGEYLARRSRGYAPFPITLDGGTGGTLACGAEQKASFALSKGRYVFLSQHIGDLKNIETLETYDDQIRLYRRLFDSVPERVVCDLHPDYLSTAYARERAEQEGLELLQVQHHHAHMASCMADNALEGPCIGVIWDGTGYGADGTVWGGEFLLGDYSGFRQFGSLRQMRLPGGDRAAKEIWRMGVALLLDAGLDAEEWFPDARVNTIKTLLQMGLNCPVCSSMGRLFDGVSAILGIRDAASYEGQGAVLLEAAAIPNDRVYPYQIHEADGVYRADFRGMLRQLCCDKRSGVSIGHMAAAFMNTLICMAAEMCEIIREQTGVNQVVLSGGTFQNLYLLERLLPALRQKGFTAVCHRRVSTNDEGISLGQTAIAEKGSVRHVSGSTPESNRN